MLRSVIPWIAYFLLVAQAAGEETIFPYKACITADDVYVRSGPGQTYYPTDKLQEGDEVEVYRHDPGGWYAIRPPEGSFTWVSGKYLTQGGNNLAVATEDGVAARVGSRFSDIRDVIQVRLHKGEVIELLDVKEVGTGPNRQTWYKIAPPSGEFRWVFGKYVDADYRASGVRRTRAAAGAETGREAAAEIGTAGEIEVTSASDAHDAPARAVSYEDEEVSPGVERGGELPPLDPSPRDDRRFDEPTAADHEPEATDADPAEAYDFHYEPEVRRKLTPEEYRNELGKLDLELSTMVVEEPTVWAFGDLRLAAEGLKRQAQTAVERGLVKVLLTKIDRFERIKSHYATLSTFRREVDLVSSRKGVGPPRLKGSDPFSDGLLARRESDVAAASPPASDPTASPGPGAAPERPAASGGGFDGVGRLTPVVSQKLDAPRYALVDEDGEVACYVTPSAGVPLGHYVGQRVGVNGTRGYIPEQRAYHIMAQHVTVLGGGGRMR